MSHHPFTFEGRAVSGGWASGAEADVLWKRERWKCLGNGNCGEFCAITPTIPGKERFLLPAMCPMLSLKREHNASGRSGFASQVW